MTKKTIISYKTKGKSDCCGASVRKEGIVKHYKNNRIDSRWYVCEKCNERCLVSLKNYKPPKLKKTHPGFKKVFTPVVTKKASKKIKKIEKVYNRAKKGANILVDEFIRDVTKVGSLPKSEVRRRLNGMLDAELARGLIEGIKNTEDGTELACENAVFVDRRRIIKILRGIIKRDSYFGSKELSDIIKLIGQK